MARGDTSLAAGALVEVDLERVLLAGRRRSEGNEALKIFDFRFSIFDLIECETGSRGWRLQTALLGELRAYLVYERRLVVWCDHHSR